MWSLAQSGESRLSEASERSVLRAAQDGSAAAIEELFRRHWRETHRAAYVIVRDAPAAEDIAQEAFLSALGALDRFDRRRPFAPWLHRIAVNRAIDWSRARTASREVGGERGGADVPAAGAGGGRPAHGGGGGVGRARHPELGEGGARRRPARGRRPPLPARVHAGGDRFD